MKQGTNAHASSPHIPRWKLAPVVWTFLSIRLSIQQQCTLYFYVERFSKVDGEDGMQELPCTWEYLLDEVIWHTPPQANKKKTPNHKGMLTWENHFYWTDSAERIILSEQDGGQRRVKMRIKCIRSEKHLIHLYIHSTKFQFSIKNRSKSAKPNQVRVFHKFAWSCMWHCSFQSSEDTQVTSLQEKK